MDIILVTGGKLIDGTGRPPVEGGAVLIQEGRIKAVGRRAEIDAHTHLSIVPGLGNQNGQLRGTANQSMLRAIPNMRKDLLSGVTTMRVVGEEHFLDIDLRDAVAAGKVPGPLSLIHI